MKIKPYFCVRHTRLWTDDEIGIYDFIDQNAKVVVKFKNINECYGELDKMRKETEEIVKSRQ